MTLKNLIIRYTAFAILATAANLATQRVILQDEMNAPYFAAAVGAGTLVGLVIKYLCDKRWIFYDIETGVKNHSRKFPLYTAMGIVTTAIFWGTETMFWLIWQTPERREVGAVLGLVVGYIGKYKLDRSFVFTDSRLAGPQ